MNKIKHEYEAIQRQLKFWYEQEKALQNKCKHKKATKEHKGSSGNYDPTQDCYWTEYKCLDCGKFWTIHYD